MIATPLPRGSPRAGNAIWQAERLAAGLALIAILILDAAGTRAKVQDEQPVR